MKLKRAGAVLLAVALIGTTAVPQGVYAEENQPQGQAEEENGAGSTENTFADRTQRG